MTIFRILACSVIGLVLGSFLTVVTHRVPAGESIVRPGSRCPRCQHPLTGLDNVPLLSYLLRGGRCRYCKVSIPPRYLSIELLTGAACGLLGWRIDRPAELPAYLVLTVGMIAASIVDLDHRRIPRSIVYATAAVGVPLLVGAAFLQHDPGWLVAGAACAGAAFAFFLAIFLITPSGIGFGDVRFAPLCAGFAGFLGWRVAAAGLVAGILLAGVSGVALLVTRRAGRKTAIPLGPFLAAGSYLAIIGGASLSSFWFR